MADSGVIETGVDKLVALVKGTKRISVPEAAKKLNVSKVVVEEWADFLEEEGIINIEYNFTTPYLVERQLSKKEVEEKVKEFKGKKEGFVRKAENTLSLLDENGDAFSDIKEEFQKLKSELGKELQGVQDELKVLEQYNKEKRDIDAEVREQEKGFKDKISEIESQVGKERLRYSEILTDIKSQQKILTDEKVKALSMKNMVDTAQISIAKYEKMTSDIKSRLEEENDLIEDVEKHIKRLEDMAQSQRKEVEDKSRVMDELAKKSETQKDRIKELEDTIIKKAIAKNRTLSKGKEADKNITVKFRKFLSHNTEVESYLNNISQDRDHLRDELKELIKKANAVTMIAKSQNLKDYVPELQKKFEQIEKDKNSFEKGLSKLKSLMKL